jgi:frataxin-like iron-binding protein CyaY
MTKTETRTPAVAADIEGTVLTLTFANSETLVIDADKLQSDIRTAAMMHGLKQKLCDAAAISRNPDTGRSATTEDKYDAVREVAERLQSANPTWNKVRGDGTGTAGLGLLVRALMQLSGKDKAFVEAQLADMDKDEQAALRTMPKIAAIITTLRPVNDKIDTSALLEKFGA